MISLQRFEDTFSLYTAQALDNYARYNLDTPNPTEYGLKIGSTVSDDRSAMAELQITGLPEGELVCLNLNLNMNGTHQFRVQLGVSPNSIDFPWYEEGWKNGEGYRSILFKAPQETMYLDIGDYMANTNLNVIVDNVELLINGVDAIADGNFDIGISDWYGATETTTLEHYEYNPPVEDNPYLETVDIPIYDSGDTSHVLITTSNGNESLLNDSGKQYFYVEPGDYKSGTWTITKSGTVENRRTISLHNGNDTHTAALPMNTTNLASVILVFNGASYWDIDRMATLTNTSDDCIKFTAGASFNTVNRLFTNETYNSVKIQKSCHNNTIQNSKLNAMSDGGRRSDKVGIELGDYGIAGGIAMDIKNTKIINNDIRNQNDGVQLVIWLKNEVWQELNCEGTIIDNNRIWIEDNIYTDGSGNYTPTGNYAHAENAVDLKAGSNNASNQMVITNNAFWGFRKTDTTNATASSLAGALSYHYGIGNTIINNNVLYDSARGFTGSDGGGKTYAIYDGEFKRNLVYECGYKGVSTSSVAVVVGSAGNFQVEDNAIINSDNSSAEQYYGKLWYSANSTFINNDQVGTSLTLHTESNSGCTTSPNTTGTAADLGYTDDYVIDYDLFAISPKQIVLANTVKP